jgi:anti-anti-sigma regulatory factor
MHFTRNENNTGTLLLEGDLTIERAAEFLEVCRQALAASDRIAVEFGEIGTADLSCLQLLCSAHRTAVAKGKQFFFAGERPDFLSDAGEQAGFIRKRKCQMNPEGQDCLWLRGTCNE